MFLQQFFKTIPNILKYHYFCVYAAKPVIAMVREYYDSDVLASNILKVDHQNIIDAGMPSLAQIKGLDPQRQWYLDEQI